MANTVPIDHDAPAARAMRRRMPRPERERQMLEVAGRSFAARGFHAVSMDEIAEQAGISKPMLYHYFGSKEGLYVAYVRQQGNALLASMRDAAEPSASPTERLWRGTLAFLGYVDEHRPGWALLYREAVSQGGLLAVEVAQLRARIAAIVQRLFLSVTGADADGTSEALAHAFVGAGESVANWWLEHPDHSREQVAQLLVRLAGGALPSVDPTRPRQ
jgi:AcrR family transcriptional regulator